MTFARTLVYDDVNRRSRKKTLVTMIPDSTVILPQNDRQQY